MLAQSDFITILFFFSIQMNFYVGLGLCPWSHIGLQYYFMSTFIEVRIAKWLKSTDCDMSRVDLSIAWFVCCLWHMIICLRFGGLRPGVLKVSDTTSDKWLNLCRAPWLSLDSQIRMNQLLNSRHVWTL